MTRYDLCILGAGPAGYAAAMRAHDMGKSVALIEANKVGGVGLENGALSSKTFWHLANDYAKAGRVGRGFQPGPIDVSYSAVAETVKQAVSERRAHLCEQLDGLASEGITLIKGKARFVSPHKVLVESEAEPLSIEAEYFLIATGSQPRCPDGIEVDGKRIVTSDHIESLAAFPESLVIVGSGVVGCEYATIFGHYGQTRIFMIDRRERILPFEDEDISECIAASFESMGVTIHRSAKLVSMVADDDKVTYKIECGGELQVHEVERALVSIGRVPNLASLDLAKAGVTLDERGGVASSLTHTNVAHIYAAGDVSMDMGMALANVAELEARYAVECMFVQCPLAIDYRAMSTIMFLNPEVASVGLGELQAKERGISHRVASIANHLITRNVAMRNTRGFIKLLAAEDDTVLGLRVVGPHASSCIEGIALLIGLGGKLGDIDRIAHPHPAVTEGVQECARLMLGRSVLKAKFIDGVRLSSWQAPD